MFDKNEINMSYREKNNYDIEIESIKDLVHNIDRIHSVSDKEGEFLYNTAARCIGKGVIVEIGSWKGVSTIWLGKGSKAGHGVKIYAVDPHIGSPIHQKMYGQIWTFENFKKNIKVSGVEDVITPVVKTSEKAIKNWNNKPIEFLWIDGDHSYDMVQLNFNLWFPFLIDGGVIAFHDATNFPGVSKVVINDIYKSKNFIHIGFIGSIVFAQKVVSNSLNDKLKNASTLFLWFLYKFLRKMRKILSDIKNLFREKIKLIFELDYWKREARRGFVKRDFKYFCTDCFNIKEDFYLDKNILDIGCGPRGSLEWADMCKERIGLDPLADSYKLLGADKHRMRYINGQAENIPFADEFFDVIFSFNSLDHVDNLSKSINEITRVLKKRGLFLLIVDVNHKPTINEPITFSWDIVKNFTNFQILMEKHYKRIPNGLYQSVLADIPYDIKLNEEGVLLVKLQKI
jgi:SAM-dependent methyltransferase/predicted O-methyltransferase YrrM